MIQRNNSNKQGRVEVPEDYVQSFSLVLSQKCVFSQAETHKLQWIILAWQHDELRVH